jgi:hypothetical protein
MNKEIEYVDLNEADIVKVVLVIEMTRSSGGKIKFEARRVKLDDLEKRFLDRFIDENL